MSRKLDLKEGRYQIELLNDEHGKAVQERLFELGYHWGRPDPKKIEPCNFIYFQVEDGHSPSLSYSSKPCNSATYCKTDYIIGTLEDLYRYPTYREVRLNDSYVAIVKDGFVKVGCQEIKFENIAELYNEIYRK